MRFDDMLATVLAREPDRPSARVTVWRQLLDLLAQRRADDGSPTLDLAIARFTALRGEVPLSVRRDSVAALAQRTVPPGLVSLLATDSPPVAGAMLSRVRLDDLEWLAILPGLTPTGRAFLRHRRDLGPHVEAALAGFGASDLTLTSAVSPQAAPEPLAPEPENAEEAPGETPPPEPAEEMAEFEDIAEPVSEPEETVSEALESWPVLPEQDAAVEEIVDEPEVRAAEDTLEEIAPEPEPEPEPEPPVAEDVASEETPEPSRVIPFAAQTAAEPPTDEEQHELPLPGARTTIEPFDPDAGEGQIRSIISRIARFRGDRDPAPRAPTEVEPVTGFRFETGIDGLIRWVSGAPRGPLIGETIARPAEGGFGVDAQAPGAFRRRAPFRDARLLVAGTSQAGGEWRIAGVPVFAPEDGRFLGYRGTARRPLADERAEPGPVPSDPARPSGDSLRQLVHELRTPLNAIGGFAEMIRRQMRGPVSLPYRERAQGIAEQAGRLMTAVDDLDVSARLDDDRVEFQHLPVSLPALLAPVCAEQAETAAARGTDFAADLPADLAAVLGDAAMIRRMVARLLSATGAVAQPGEALRLRGATTADGVEIAVSRPARLAEMEDGPLFDPGYGPEGDSPDAPLLGLGFSLHLVRRLAAATGGQLLVGAEWFTLHLPTAEPASDADAG